MNNASRAAGSSGGVNAVAGLLFQMIGSAAFAVGLFEKQSSSGGDYDMSFSLEPYDQDAGSQKEESNRKISLRLVQFKYSGKPHENAIATGVLLEIAEAFRLSEARARKALGDHLVEYELWTNRPVTPDGAKTLEDAEGNVPNAKLDEIDSEKDRTASKNEAYREIFKCLSIRELKENEAIEAVRMHARKFGVTDAEFPNAAERVVMHFFRLAGAGLNEVSRRTFDELLTGFPDPRDLTLSGVTHNLQTELDTFRLNARLPLDFGSRAIVQDIETAVQNNALIVIHGEGGCGKSAAVYSALGAAVRQSPSGRYVAAQFAVRIAQNWFGEKVARWRGAPPNHYGADRSEIALERLEIASGSKPRPLALLAIDGWDELNSNCPEKSSLCSLLEFVADEWQKATNGVSRIVLLVTCRHPTDVDSVWPHHTGQMSEGFGIKHIRVGDFNPQELQKLAQKYLKPDIECRLSVGHAIGVAPQTLGMIASTATLTRPVNTEVREAVGHPLFWRFFLEQKPDQQNLILDGNKTALWVVCRSYLEWFCAKAISKSFGADQHALKAMITRIAMAPCPLDGLLHQEEHWTAPACGVDSSRILKADELFREALSFGLISIDSPASYKPNSTVWRWRYSFILEFLQTQPF